MTKKLLILTADAGFGHRAAANAVAEAVRERYGNYCEVTIVNPLEDRRTPAVLRRVESDYDRLVLESPELYRFGYRAMDKAFPVSMIEQALIAMLGRTMQRLLQVHQPDVVLTTYPLYQAPVAAVFAIRRTYVPLITVVTDLASVHTLWFSDEVDLCLVPTRIVLEKALQAGLSKGAVEVTGLPVNPALAHHVDRRALRAELGWSMPDSGRVVILFAGSKRVTRLEPIVDALNHSGLALELALVSGGNEELLQSWRHTRWHQPAHVYGYVDNMATLIQAADCIACKAGGLIVSEALAVGLPLLLIEAIPGQETGNAELVVQSGAGDMADDPLAALATVYHWLEKNCELLSVRAANAARLGRPYAANRVAELAWQSALQGPLHREHRFLTQAPLLKQLLKETRLPDGTSDRSRRRVRRVNTSR